MDDFACSQCLPRPPFHGDLGGQSTQVGHAVGVRGVIESTCSLADQLHARLVGGDEGVGRHLHGKELLAEEGQLHEVQQLLEVGLSLGEVVLGPVDESREDRFLTVREMEVVAAQEVLHAGVGDVDKPLILRHLGEISAGEGERGLQELLAGLELGKVGHVQTHGAVEAVLEKLAAGLACPEHLEEVGRGQEALGILLVDLQSTGVRKLYEEGEGVRVNTLYDNSPLSTLCHLSTEHGSKVHTAGCQHHAVGPEALLVHDQLHVAQLLVATELLHALQGLLREGLVDKVGHLEFRERRG